MLFGVSGKNPGQLKTVYLEYGTQQLTDEFAHYNLMTGSYPSFNFY